MAVLRLADFLSCCFSAQQDSIKKANMKRENKAYSFKEQIIELELKEVRTGRHCTRSAGQAQWPQAGGASCRTYTLPLGHSEAKGMLL